MKYQNAITTGRKRYSNTLIARFADKKIDWSVIDETDNERAYR